MPVNLVKELKLELEPEPIGPSSTNHLIHHHFSNFGLKSHPQSYDDKWTSYGKTLPSFKKNDKEWDDHPGLEGGKKLKKSSIRLSKETGLELKLF